MNVIQNRSFFLLGLFFSALIQPSVLNATEHVIAAQVKKLKSRPDPILNRMLTKWVENSEPAKEQDLAVFFEKKKDWKCQEVDLFASNFYVSDLEGKFVVKGEKKIFQLQRVDRDGKTMPYVIFPHRLVHSQDKTDLEPTQRKNHHEKTLTVRAPLQKKFVDFVRTEMDGGLMLAISGEKTPSKTGYEGCLRKSTNGSQKGFYISFGTRGPVPQIKPNMDEFITSNYCTDRTANGVYIMESLAFCIEKE